jgi:periplasmic divalent cation tolerance protein
MAQGSEQGDEDTPRIAVTTVASAAEAERMARTLVDRRLAACVTVLPQVTSTYRWEGRIETETEQLLWIKTTQRRLPELERELLSLHSYDVPEFLVLSVERASMDYLGWLVASTRSVGTGSPDRHSRESTT